jgi:hypothetical protein
LNNIFTDIPICDIGSPCKKENSLTEDKKQLKKGSYNTILEDYLDFEYKPSPSKNHKQ